MRLYAEVARRAFRRYATYKWATVAGLVTNTIFGFMRAYIFVELFRHRDRVGLMRVEDAVTYVFVTQGLLMVIFMWGDTELSERVRSGMIATDLSRPFDFQMYWLAQDAGRAAFHLLARGVPPFLAASFVFDLRLPQEPLTLVLLPIALALAVVVSFAMRFLVGLASFWLLDHRGVTNTASLLTMFFSGFVIPVNMFPNGLRSLASVLPFAAMVETPNLVFLERLGTEGALAAIAVQAVWALVLLMLGRLMLRSATRKLVVQGG